MDLLKYLEPMKHLPDMFSNLAFWRGCRKFKDAVVNAFEYVDSWGTHIESLLPSGEYVKSQSVTLTPDVEFYQSDLSEKIFTLSTSSDGVVTILPYLSVVGQPFRMNLSTEKTSVIIGKKIDAVRVEYLTTDRATVQFELPSPIFESVYFHGGYVNGCAINQCTVFSRYVTISSSKIATYENLTLRSVKIYYH